MKNKKGFTLTELLVVITLLVTILGTSVFGIEEISKMSREKELEELEKRIESAADIYINNKEVYRMELLTEHCTRIYTLQNEGLLKLKLVNPITNELIPANLCVTSKLNEDGVIISEFEIN